MASPPPFYNFTVIPEVTSRDAHWEMKKQDQTDVVYEDIHMPKSTAVGIYISAFGTLACFAFVWNIIWLIVVSIISIIVTFIVRGFNEHPEYTLKAAKVKEYEEARAEKAKAYEVVDQSGEDMGIKELIKFIYDFALDAIRNKRWRQW